MKKRTIWIIIAVLVVGIAAAYYYVKRTATSLMAEATERRALLDQIMQIEEASMDKNWKTAIQVAERLSSGGHANDERLLATYLDLADAYFHEYRYEDAAKTAQQYLVFIEKRKDSKNLPWLASLRVAQYLSFCYAKTGDAQFRTATENQIRDSLKRMPTDMKTYDIYYNYGGTKYRLETRELVTDEEYMRKNTKQITTDHDYVLNLANSVSVWLQSIKGI
jgi:hypothetical protein